MSVCDELALWVPYAPKSDMLATQTLVSTLTMMVKALCNFDVCLACCVGLPGGRGR